VTLAARSLERSAALAEETAARAERFGLTAAATSARAGAMDARRAAGACLAFGDGRDRTASGCTDMAR